MGRVERHRSITTTIAATGIGMSLLSGCSGGGGSTEATVASTVANDSSTAPRRNVDGRLRIGVWLPTSGPAAALGTQLKIGIDIAVEEINNAGGVNRQLVEVVTRDEGSDPSSAFQALRELLDDEQVDVIVGPASSRVALGALDTLAEARVITCSPTSTALNLDDRRDNGYFVRTIGSEAFEAKALTRAMIKTGLQTFAVLYPEDDYGSDYANEMQRAFRQLRVGDVELVPYDTTQRQFNVPVTEALADGAEAIAVVGTDDVGALVLRALAANDAAPDEVPTFVSSGLRVDDLSMLIDPQRPAAAEGIRGVSPLARAADPTFAETFTMASPGDVMTYAAYAYDCVNLLALAAQAARTDEPEELQAEIAAVSTGGSICRRFSSCAELLADGRSIDLEGASGDLELQDDGDVGVALYDHFEYDAEGRDVSIETIPVRADIA
jgi:branched-chain amino acid transport system substrate-binding protein